MSSEQNMIQHGGSHYKKSPLEHWDVVAIYNVDYFRSCATKYLLRCWEKAGLLDVKKARHFLAKRMEVAAQLGPMTYVPNQVVDHLIQVFGVTDENQADAIRCAFNKPGDMQDIDELIEDVEKNSEKWSVKTVIVDSATDFSKLQEIADRTLGTSDLARSMGLTGPGTPEDGGHHARQPVTIQTLDDIVPESETRERHPLNCTWTEYVAIQSRTIDHGTYAGHSWGQLYLKDEEGRYAMLPTYHSEYGKL